MPWLVLGCLHLGFEFLEKLSEITDASGEFEVANHFLGGHRSWEHSPHNIVPAFRLRESPPRGNSLPHERAPCTLKPPLIALEDMTKSLLAIALTTLLVGGCASTLIGSKPWFENNERNKSEVAKKASFDMGCEAEKLTFSPLGSDQDGYESVGVSGCDKKMTFVYVEQSGEWIANTATTSQ